MPKIRPIGHRQMHILIWRDQIDGMDWDVRTNNRKANCKVCGADIPKGQGAYWRRYGPNNQIRFTRNYLCADCQNIWGNLSPRKAKPRFGKPVTRYLPTCWDAEQIKQHLDITVLE